MRPTKELLIPLEDLYQPNWQARYVGGRARYATASSVRFLDAHTLVCCSLLGRVIYLIRFDLDGARYEVLDRQTTLYAGRSTETDLCDVDGRGYVVTSNCESSSLSLYRRVGDEIQYVRDLPTGLLGNFCHGVRFWAPDVVVTTTLREPRGAHFFDLASMRSLLYVATDRLPKDVCILSGDRAVLITTDGSPELARVEEQRRSEIVVVRVDLTERRHVVIGRQLCDAGQLDSIVAYADRLYVVDSHGGRVLVVDASTLQQVDQVEGLDVPHGIDVNYGMMAITCYGTNSIQVRSLRSA